MVVRGSARGRKRSTGVFGWSFGDDLRAPLQSYEGRDAPRRKKPLKQATNNSGVITKADTEKCGARSAFTADPHSSTRRALPTTIGCCAEQTSLLWPPVGISSFSFLAFYSDKFLQLNWYTFNARFSGTNVKNLGSIRSETDLCHPFKQS